MGGGSGEPEKMVQHRKQQADAGQAPQAFSSRTVRLPREQRVTHPRVDPALGGIRESRDLNGQETQAVLVSFDVTGSNIENMKRFSQQAHDMLGLMNVEGWGGEHSNIQFGAIGDFRSDKCAIQLGQFEHDAVALSDVLDSIVLEGGGGNNDHESYLDMMHVLNTQNQIDSWKRGERPLCFMLFDERIRDTIDATSLNNMYNNMNKLIASEGATLTPSQLKRTVDHMEMTTENLTAAQVVAEFKRKYRVFPITILGGENKARQVYEVQVPNGQPGEMMRESTVDQWRRFFGNEAVIELEDGANAVLTIAAIVGANHDVSSNAIAEQLSLRGMSSQNVEKTLMLAAPARNSRKNSIQRIDGRNGIGRI